MQKFMDWMERNIVPIAGKIGSQRHMVAMRDGFATMLPLMLIGGFSLLIKNFPNDYVRLTLMGEGGPLESVKIMFLSIYGGTMYLMALFAAITIGYHLGKGYDCDALATALVSTAAGFILMDINQFQSPVTWSGRNYGWVQGGGWQPGLYTRWLSAEGLITTIIVTLIVGSLFCKLSKSGKLDIKLPDGVPPAVSRSFSAIFPAAIVLVGTGLVFIIGKKVFGIDDMYWSVFITIVTPLMSLGNSLIAALVLILIQQILWFFGLHGSNIILPAVNSIFLPLIAVNAAAVANGGKTYIVTSQFLDSFVNLGGSGATLGLMIIMIVKSKSKINKSIAKVATGPSIFNINEPILFGLPIVLNPMYIIPFILAPIVSAIIAYTLTSIGFVGVTTTMVFWTVPPILSAFLATGQWQGAVTALICLVVSCLIYLPFVLEADKQNLKKENELEVSSSLNM